MTPDADADTPSILSRGEREIAALLRDGHSPEEIADRRDQPTETVEKAIDRIRTKTDRALATLRQSPYTEDAAAALDDDARRRLLTRLEDA